MFEISKCDVCGHIGQDVEYVNAIINKWDYIPSFYRCKSINACNARREGIPKRHVVLTFRGTSRQMAAWLETLAKGSHITIGELATRASNNG